MNISYRLNITAAVLISLSLAACTTTKHENPQKQVPAPQVEKKPSYSPLHKPAHVPSGLKRYKDRVLLYAEFDANRRSPIKVNLVFIHDAVLLPEISQLSAQEWFARRHALSLKYSNALSIVSNEVLPGEKKHLKPFTKRQKQAAMIVLFSSYFSEDEHKVVIKPKDINYVYLMKNNFIAK